MHTMPDVSTTLTRSNRSRRATRVGPTAYLVPKRDGQPDDHLVVIDGDTMLVDHRLPANYVFPDDADDALRHLGFRRATAWLPRGDRGGHRCAVELDERSTP